LLGTLLRLRFVIDGVKEKETLFVLSLLHDAPFHANDDP